MFSSDMTAVRHDDAPLHLDGKMQTLISAFDWSATPLGARSTWEVSLKQAVDLILQCPMPATLLWGPAGTLIYNDAYSKLAEDRHPQILGLTVFEAWPETRDVIAEIQKAVFEGRSQSFKDQKLAVQRHGTVQSGWFNLDFSPVYSKDGATQGILAIVVETTNDVLTRQARRTEQQRFAHMFENAPGLMAILRGPAHTFEFVNASYTKLVGQRELIGKPVREALPELENQGIYELLDNAFHSSNPYIGSAVPMVFQRHKDGTFEERFIDFVYEPLKDSNGIVTGIFVEGHDVTDHEVARKDLYRQSRLMRSGEQCAKVGSWEFDVLGNTLFCTEETSRILQFDQSTGLSSIDLFKERINEAHLGAFETALENAILGKDMDIELEITTREMELRYIHLRGTRSTEAGPAKIYGSMQDITHHKYISHELQLRDRCLEAASDGVIITDPNLPDNPIIYCNSGFLKLTGYTKEEIIGRNCRFLQGKDTDDVEITRIRDHLHNHKPYLSTIKNYRRNGTIFWNRLSITPVFDDGVLTNFIGVQTDLTESVELSSVVAHQSTHDHLTDLINRQEFEKRLELAVNTSESTGSTYALAHLDLDNFRIVNEMNGDAVGDQILVKTAEAIKSCQTADTTISRLGADQYAILLANATAQDGLALAQSLLSEVSQIKLLWREKPIRLKASIGLVLGTRGSSSALNLLKEADSACDTAKLNGGGCIHVHRIEDYSSRRRQTDIELYSQILTGLEENNFFLVHQTISPLNENDETGSHFELLIRLKDSWSGQILSPADFIPAAERLRLSPKLDQWVIDNAFSTLSKNPKYSARRYLCSINLSAISINQNAFAEYILEKLMEYKIPPSQICFEITETAVIENMETATRFMKKVRDVGCLFALDDFGSGLSSYGYLRTLSVDFVKIDGSFVKNMHLDEMDYAIVKSIHDLATLMGKRTIAEFVENELIVENLKELGVDFAQGYGVGRPEPFQIWR